MLKTAFAVLLLTPAIAAMPAAAQDVFETDKTPILVETLADGLDHPWGIAFLPDGGMIVTERSGSHALRLGRR